jgi:hypothetical protein
MQQAPVHPSPETDPFWHQQVAILFHEATEITRPRLATLEPSGNVDMLSRHRIIVCAARQSMEISGTLVRKQEYFDSSLQLGRVGLPGNQSV